MRPVLYPCSNIILPPRLCGGIDDYVPVWAYGRSATDWSVQFDKRDKRAHRFTIADVRGPLQLTVPIAKPHSSRCRWDEVRISTHGAWWDVHRVALESAYGRTPYFEFYIDRFLPMLTAGVEDRYPRLHTLARAWDREIRDILGTEPAADETPDTGIGAATATTPPQHEAYRHKAATPLQLPPYRQVRQDSLGFIAGLSILDLIFNLGPEAQIYLNNAARQAYTQDTQQCE